MTGELIFDNPFQVGSASMRAAFIDAFGHANGPIEGGIAVDN